MTVAHVAVNVSDWVAAKGFYAAVLGPLGYRIVYEEDGALAYFADRQGLDFGIGRRDPAGGAHVAFECPGSRRGGRVLRDRAPGTGGRDNGPPGIRVQYDARTTTPPTSSIRTATTSRRSATTHRSPERRRNRADGAQRCSLSSPRERASVATVRSRPSSRPVAAAHRREGLRIALHPVLGDIETGRLGLGVRADAESRLHRPEHEERRAERERADGRQAESLRTELRRGAGVEQPARARAEALGEAPAR